MNMLWETLREFSSTLVTLFRAQTILVPLITSWVFTGMWVYTTERKRHGHTRSGRAFLGLFWLPGLLVYYLFQKDAQLPQSQGHTFTAQRTPETARAEDFQRNSSADAVTFDGVQTVDKVSRTRRWHQETDDGSTTRASVRGSKTATSSAPTPFSLEVLSGKLKGQKLQAPPGAREVGIGTRRNNQIQLPDSKVAPWHVVLKYERTGEWVLRVVEHAAAKYETKINGKVLKVKPLEHRDVIQLGNVRLRYHWPGP